MKTQLLAFMIAGVAACTQPARSHAAGAAPDAAFAQAGFAPAGARSLTLGAAWNWDWQGRLGNTQATASTEVFASQWSARAPDGRDTVTQLGLMPVIRLRLDHGRSPWFMEGGVGLTLTDHLYRNGGKQFGTRFNFIDMFGVGRSLDAQHRHEVSLRLAHFSNAEIKQPNPGENFLQLRYAVAF